MLCTGGGADVPIARSLVSGSWPVEEMSEYVYQPYGR
jgi:hypothetical protein